ncbi:MAG: type I polyketide synthase, partial [Cytophagaceae bacterium]
GPPTAVPGAAAGVAGFIKTTLALYHKQLPASLGFSTPNPNIDFAGSPFFVNTRLTDWKPATQGDTMLRRAGVSSFGVGGTNVHVVLEEYVPELPAPSTVERSKKQRSAQLISWSAKSTESCSAYANRLAVHLQKNSNVKLGDVAFTLHTTRVNFNHRQFVVAATGGELVDTLLNSALSPAKTVKETPGEIVFLFPGQGSQYINMGRELYENELVYKQAVDECAELLSAHLDTDIRQIMYPDELSRGAEERLKNTLYTQSALFVTEYALARLWMSWGIEPSVFCGHSIGEFVAAHLAGVFSLADVLTVIAMRGRLVSELPRGSMLSVRMEADKVGVLMPEPLSIAAINSNKLCVVAGHDE